MKNFIYETPTRVYFGRDEERKVGKLVAEFAPKKVLLDRVRKSLSEENIPFVELGGVVANPELALVRKGIALCLAEGVDFVLAVGGGSVMDSAKDIAMALTAPQVPIVPIPKPSASDILKASTGSAPITLQKEQTTDCAQLKRNPKFIVK